MTHVCNVIRGETLLAVIFDSAVGSQLERHWFRTHLQAGRLAVVEMQILATPGCHANQTQ